MPSIAKKHKDAAHTIEENKNELAIKLLSLKDEESVQMLKVIFEDITSNSKKISKVRYNKEIDAAVKRVRNGKSIPNQQVMDEMDTW
ncbi:MAG: hypothetical protein K0S33_3025 [Bacteroidetes bacterium]|jgi:hypothetical protein|nr:hypothetical protein [Bacteroidota bacterium]